MNRLWLSVVMLMCIIIGGFMGIIVSHHALHQRYDWAVWILVTLVGAFLTFLAIYDRRVKRGVTGLLVVSLLIPSGIFAAETPVGESSYSDMEFFPRGEIRPFLSLDEILLQEQPEKGTVPIAVTIIVIGGVTIWGLYTACSKLFPSNPPPQNPDNSGGGNGGGGEDSYGMMVSYHGYCNSGDISLSSVSSLSEPKLTMTEVTVTIGNTSESPRFSFIRTVGPEGCYEDRAEYGRAMLAHGLDINRLGGVQYSKNGRPVSVGEIPLSFDDETRTCVIGGQNQVNMVLEYSSDSGLNRTWIPVVNIKAPQGGKHVIRHETTAVMTMYRIRVLP